MALALEEIRTEEEPVFESNIEIEILERLWCVPFLRSDISVVISSLNLSEFQNSPSLRLLTTLCYVVFILL